MRHPSLVALAPALIALASSVHAACPPTTYLYGGLDPSIPIVVTAPSHETTFSIQGCDQVHGRAQVSAGLLIASIDHACASGGSAGPSGLETILEDDFTVVGLADGTPVSFDAVLDVQGSASTFSEPGGPGGGRVRGLIHAGPTSETLSQHATNGVTPYVAVDEALTLPLNAVAGTPLTLRFAVRAEAFDGNALLQGVFHFANLPPGAHVTSCRGYSSDAPVTARVSTWGRLKLRYR